MFVFREMKPRRLQKRTGSAAQLFSEKDLYAGQDILLAQYEKHRTGSTGSVLSAVGANESSPAHAIWKQHGYLALWRGVVHSINGEGFVEVVQSHQTKEFKHVQINELPSMLEPIEPEPVWHALAYIGLAPKKPEDYQELMRSKNKWLPLVVLDMNVLLTESAVA